MSSPAQRLTTAAEIPLEWIVLLAGILAREGQAYDISRDALTLQVQSINTGEWMPILLPTGGHVFASPADAGAIYAAIFAEILRMQIEAA